MTYLVFLILWPLFGIACFILARSVWQRANGQAPFTLDTLIKMLILMWFPPLSLLAAAVWWRLRDDAKIAGSFDEPTQNDSQPSA